MNRVLPAGILIVALLLFGGCVSHPSYPRTWPAMATTAEGTCPDLSGVFSDAGERAPSQSAAYTPSLSRVLFARRQALKSATRVEIHRQNSSVWRVSAMSDGLTLATADVTAQGPCLEGEAKITDPHEEGGINREGVVGFQWSTLYFSRASDRSLVVRYASGGVGLMLLIPAAGSQWVWYRFRDEDLGTGTTSARE